MFSFKIHIDMHSVTRHSYSMHSHAHVFKKNTVKCLTYATNKPLYITYIVEHDSPPRTAILMYVIEKTLATNMVEGIFVGYIYKLARY